jgi:iron complex outermembrane receptor protein
LGTRKKPALGACGLLGTVSLLAIALPQTSFAQPADQPAASNSGLEEIVVTARRKDEKLQTVPIAISALNTEQVQQRNITNIESLGSAIPSLSSYQESRDEEGIIMRGQSGTGVSAQGQEPAITTYFAQVPFPDGDGVGVGRYFDLDNIQVLKGPQGTLFGRNSTGGAILFEPKRPNNNFEGYAQIQLGNYNDHEFEAALNIPIVTDKVLLRVAGTFAERDGFTYNAMTKQDLDNRDYWAGRAGLTLRPTDDIENYLLIDSLYSHTNGTSEIIRALSPGFFSAFGPTFPALVLGIQAQQQKLGIREEQSDIYGLDKTISQGITDIFRWDIADGLTFKNIAAYREYRQLQRWDLDGTPLPLIEYNTPGGWSNRVSQYTEEAQIQGKALNDRLDWTVGGLLLFSHPGGEAAFNELQFFTPIFQTIHPTERSQSVYGQGTYDFSDWIPGLKFTAGYRYTWDYRGLDSYKTSGGACGFTDFNFNPVCNISVQTRSGDPSWNLGVDYQITPDTLLYVSGRQGYRSGGVNTQAFNAGQLIFKPEKVKSVEVGVKSEWDLEGMHARTNLALYNTDFTAIQASEAFSQLVNGAPETVNLIGNFGTATIQGVELDATLIPLTGLEITLAYAYTDGRYDNFLDIQTGGSELGRPFSWTPPQKFSINTRYKLPLDAALGDISVQATWDHSSHVYFASNTDIVQPVSSYDNVSARIDWKDIMGQPVDLGLFVTNLLNADYGTGGIAVYDAAGFSSYVWSEPRMYGAQLKYHFGGPAAEPEAAPAAYVPPLVQAPAPAPHSYLVFFDFNKSDLTPQAVTIVNQAASNAGPAKVTQLMVTGHTDTVGSDAYNMRLSRRRAESVAAQLEKDGIASSEIEIVAKGKRDLLVPTADGVKEPQNRRVQIVYSESPTS